MCGIVGYVGNNDAAPVLLHGLAKLEYRGYDSAGICVRQNNLEPVIVKAEGKLKNLIDKTDSGKSLVGTSGIGHTRWATHGNPTVENAHPHHSDDYNVIGVHNGIIENYQELKDKLLRNGYTFYSETDTEVIIKLIDYYCKKYKKGPIDAINKAMVRARGSYALAIMCKNYPDQIWFAKKGSPLIVAKGNDGCYLASDVPAILKYAKNVYYPEDYECGVITKDSIKFYDLNGDELKNKKSVLIELDADSADKRNYPHFMIKEIEEQPEVIQKTLNHYLKNDVIDFSETGLTDDFLASIRNIYIYACGSAYHTGVVAQYIMEEISGVNVRVELASEYKYIEYSQRPQSLVIAISQSGETKDTHESVLKAKERNIPTLSICNVQKSTIARSSDYNMYTYAGLEIAVATTKAYSCQLINLYLLAIKLGRLNGTINDDLYNELISDFKRIPSLVKEIIEEKNQIQRIAQNLVPMKDVFFIGRGLDYTICLEGALKLKEITYINANAYAAGELKHGTISLIDEHVGVIALDTQSKLYEKTKSNMVEVKARNGKVLAVTNYGNYNVDSVSNDQIYVPKINEYLTPSLAIISLQMLAYYASIAKGINPDKPRNLAKSVTVE